MGKLSKLATVILASMALGSQPALAEQSEIEALKQQLQQLQKRLEQLESAQQATPEPKNLPAAATEGLSFYGVVEVEASYNDHDIDGSSSDLVVATVEVGVEATITDTITANVSALYEEDDTDLEIDVATITVEQLAGTDLALAVGQNYLPFGSFNTHLINDTLVLELAETRETAAGLTWEGHGIAATVYAFNGDVDDGNDTIENVGLSLNYSADSYSIGADYISNILDSDGLSGFFEDDLGLALDSIDDSAGAYIVHAAATLANTDLLVEYIKSEQFSVDTWLDREPEVLHLEVAHHLNGWTLALAYQETDDAEGLLPEQRLSLGATVEITDNVGLGLEYWNDEDYDGIETDNLIMQLGVQF